MIDRRSTTKKNRGGIMYAKRHTIIYLLLFILSFFVVGFTDNKPIFKFSIENIEKYIDKGNAAVKKASPDMPPLVRFNETLRMPMESMGFSYDKTIRFVIESDDETLATRIPNSPHGGMMMTVLMLGVDVLMENSSEALKKGLISKETNVALVNLKKKQQEEYNREKEQENEELSNALLEEGNGLKDKYNLNDAIVAYSKGIQVYSRNEKIYEERGLAYKEIGEYENAVKDFVKVLELNPNNKTIKLALSQVYALLDNSVEACKLMGELLAFGYPKDVFKKHSDYEFIRNSQCYVDIIQGQ